MKQLARVVPLVDGVGGVDALVALEPDQPSPQHVCHDLGGFRLPHSGLTFDEEGLPELQREEDRGGEGPVADVALLAKPFDDGLDRIRRGPSHLN